MKTGRLALLCAGVVMPTVVFVAPAHANAQEQTFSFSIPAQDMKSSVKAFARVTRQQVIYDGSDLRGKKSTALVGTYSARTGLQRLLGDSGLTATWGRTGVAVIKPATPTSTTRRAAQESSVSRPAPGADAETAAEEQPAEITVTGSRIQRQVQTESPVPIVSIGIADIQASGATELSEILVDYPAVTPETNLANSSNQINASGLSTVSLRDLGVDRTLTLIDGRRAVSNSMSGNRVSLSTIPTMFVEKVEIITGGASAIYGSDAIAGVINVITRSKYDGLKIGGRTSMSEQGDFQRYNADALFGKTFADDRVSVVLGISYEKEKGASASQRADSLLPVSYSQASDLDPNNQGDLGINYAALSSTTPSGRYLSSTTSGGGYYVYAEDGTLFQTTDLAKYGYNTRNTIQLSIPRESIMGAAKITADITDTIKFFAHGEYSVINTDANRGYDTASNSETYGVLDEYTVGRIPRANPFVPAAIRAKASSSGVQWSRRFVELGVYGNYNKRKTLRTWAGFNGKIGSNWNWEVSYGYGRFNQRQDRHGAINLENLTYALNAEYDPAYPNDLTRVRCVSATARAAGCVPINIFGAGSISDAAADYIGTSMYLDALVTQNVLQGYVSGELFQLPAGPVSVALGGEYRRDWQRTVTDDVTRRGIGTASFIAEYEGNIKAKEAFGEISIPIFKEQPFAHELTLDAAARIGDYNIANVGSVFSYRFGGGWAPVRGLKFRAQYARSQRAPTITNLYSPLRDDSDTVVDPCNGITATSTGVTATNCRSVSTIAAQITSLGVFNQDSTSIKGPNSGNPDLKEETATTFTLGAVVTPSFLPGLSLTIDYFNIKVKDAIGSLSASQLATECYGNPDGLTDNQFCNAITRDEEGQITRIVNTDLNLNNIVRSGIDIGLDYRFAAPAFLSQSGKFDFRVLYSRIFDYYVEFNGVNGVTHDKLKGKIDAWVNTGQVQLGYQDGPLRLRWKARYLGKAVDSNVRLANAIAAGSNPPFLHVGDRVKHDFYVSVDVKGMGPGFRIYGGINNAFNSKSPFLPSGTESGGSSNVSGAYDIVGRAFNIGFEAKF